MGTRQPRRRSFRPQVKVKHVEAPDAKARLGKTYQVILGAAGRAQQAGAQDGGKEGIDGGTQ